MSLTRAELKKAIDAHEAGQERPSGTTWSAARVPQFLSFAEEEELNTTGVMPKSALNRYQTELELMSFFDANGKKLEGKARSKALASVLDPNAPSQTASTEPAEDTDADEADETAPAKHTRK